VTLD
jgi:hypothetical protein